MNDTFTKVEREKMAQLEKVVHALNRKVLELENEVKEMKKKRTHTQKDVVNSQLDIGKEKDSEEEKETNENCLIDKISFNSSEIKDNSSTPKESKDEGKKSKSKEDVISCEICNYTCKKENSLKKHMLTKHESHKCKECKEKLPSFMKLPKHVADFHYTDQEHKDEDEQKVIADKDQLFDYMLLKDLEDNKEYEKDSTFVFQESMMDEFVDKN